MADVQPSQIRIGDTERESALSALNEHMSAGRLDIDEYGDRTARVATAKTRGDLLALFGDLPSPHPVFGMPAPQPVPEPEWAPAPPALAQRNYAMRQRLAASAVPLAALVALALFFVVHFWVVFLIPAAVVLLSGAVFGDDWKHQRRMMREQQRQQIREIRRRGRGW